jgi:hypothetical protein
VRAALRRRLDLVRLNSAETVGRCLESQSERGELAMMPPCAGIGESIDLARLVGVADAVGSGLAGCVGVGDLVADQGTWGGVGVAGGDGLWSRSSRARDDDADRAVK